MAETTDADRIATDRAAAAKKLEEDTRKRLADEKAAREKQLAEKLAADGSVKPTPTQEENDLAASGVQVTLEPDGSPEQPPKPTPPDPPAGAKTTKAMEAEKPAPASTSKSSYSTKTE